MISTRIIDNDMGAVAKVPLTSVGTIHGLTIDLDGVKLPEYNVGLTTTLVPEMGVDKFTDFVHEQLPTAEDALKKQFVEQYIKFAQSLRGKIIPSY